MEDWLVLLQPADVVSVRNSMVEYASHKGRVVGSTPTGPIGVNYLVGEVMIDARLPKFNEVKKWIEDNKFELVDKSFGQGCKGCIVSAIEIMLATKYPEFIPKLKDGCPMDRIFLPNMISHDAMSAIVSGFDNSSFRDTEYLEYYDYGRKFRDLLPEESVHRF